MWTSNAPKCVLRIVFPVNKLWGTTQVSRSLVEAAGWRIGAQQIWFWVFGLQIGPLYADKLHFYCISKLSCRGKTCGEHAEQGAFQSGAVKVLTFYRGGDGLGLLRRLHRQPTGTSRSYEWSHQLLPAHLAFLSTTEISPSLNSPNKQIHYSQQHSPEKAKNELIKKGERMKKDIIAG